MSRLEAAVAVIGLSLMVVAVGAIDWRLGLFVAGALVAGSVYDVQNRRRP